MTFDADLRWAKTWLKEEKKQYINGQWVAGAGQAWDVKHPATGETLSMQFCDAAVIAIGCRKNDKFPSLQPKHQFTGAGFDCGFASGDRR